jgi:Domain of unknown function (DUF4153)
MLELFQATKLLKILKKRLLSPSIIKILNYSNLQLLNLLKMMKLPSMNFLSTAFLQAWQRFPLSMVAACLGTYAMFITLDREANTMQFLRLFMVTLLALPLVTGVTAWAESRKLSLPLHLFVQAIAVGICVFFYFYMDDASKDYEYVRIPRYMISVAIAHLWVSFAPFLKSENVSDFWEYNKQLFGNYVIGAAYSAILFAGIGVAHLAINQLFDLDLSEKNYARLFLLLAGIFNTAYFLFHFPKDFKFDRTETEYNASFLNLCKYILVPIVGLYFLILYAYSAKIGVTWSLPKGWVSSLIIGFASAGIFTWLISYLLPEKEGEKSIVSTYRKWFWLVLFPMIGMLFIAIGKRIMDYGVTEERFLVAHTGSWLLLCCIFFVIVKSNDLKFIPMSLAAFLLVGIVGPFSAFESSKRSQINILRESLTKDGILSDGKIKQGTATEPIKVESALRFLEQRNAIDRIQPWFEVNFDSLCAKLNVSDKTYAISNTLNLNLTESANANMEEYYYINQDDNIKSMPIGEYDEFCTFNIYYLANTTENNGSMTLKENGSMLEYRVFDENKKIIFTETFDFQPFIKNCFTLGDSEHLSVFNQKNIFDLEGKVYKARFYITNGNFINKKGVYCFQSLLGIAFLKKK